MSWAGISAGGSSIVHQAGGDGAARHAVILGGVGVLGHDHAALALDGPHAQGAVAAGARKHDADGPLALVLGQGAEEEVDRQTLAAGRSTVPAAAACRSEKPCRGWAG